MSFSESRGAFGRGHGGFALSVFGTALATALTIAALFLFDGGSGFAGVAFVVAFIGASFIIGVAAVLIGLPLTWLLESNRLERPWTYPLAGFIAGGAVVIIFAALPGVARGEEMAEILPFTLIGALPGCLCGALWWWFDRRHMQYPRGAGEGNQYG